MRCILSLAIAYKITLKVKNHNESVLKISKKMIMH